MYIGIDVGSISMKAVIIDENDKIIKSYYTRNQGLMATIRDVMKNIQIDNEIKGVGITGSGREFITALIGGDIIESEVIAHFVGTTNLYPNVKTIIDVGGEDSKLMLINDGNLTSFSMNSACGGGTGSMIESIALRMGISIEDVGDIALQSKNKVVIASKCGVFAQSDVVSKLNKGIAREDILMGVLRGFIGNYFTMLAKGKRLSPPYVFQGATAKNKALVKCFEEELKDNVIVPEYPELMGAFGMALLSKEDFKGNSKFRGFDKINAEFTTRTYFGKGCSNECEITLIYDKDEEIGHFGNRCENCIINKQFYLGDK